MLTVTEAASRLGVSRRRVIAMIEAGQLPAEKFANVYAINESDLALVADRKPGRPKKQSADEGKGKKKSVKQRAVKKPKRATKAAKKSGKVQK